MALVAGTRHGIKQRRESYLVSTVIQPWQQGSHSGCWRGHGLEEEDLLVQLDIGPGGH